MSYIDFLLEAGYSKPALTLKMEDKVEVVHTMCLHHAILKSKAELDQLIQGLETHGVHALMKKYPLILESFFVYRKEDDITAGTA